ncbi:L,D-transpeptidase family protein [Neobacillus sp. OS1-2]|uniref:L,D-transpeptidase family protein n=1 Tax=Neobacillus sp. OS1-2 TaxID=3070680 RepID=UPI0027DFC7A1|nr:L,D-transpeptidase family protein [Neobacillus sp. OS1-2]WML42256.1 L,D-transpeptidase family protein [Neobacillus sp. OS1-2]
MVSSVIGILAIVFAGIYYHQSTQFNKHVTINNTKVGGLTADQALKKLASSVLKNKVYVGKEQIFDGKDTKMGFTAKDLPSVKKLLKRQQTFWPSSKEKNYRLQPSKTDQYRTQTLKKLVEDKLISMNTSLLVPKDAEARLEQGKIIVSESVDGKQHDVAQLMKAYQNHDYTSEIHLKTAYIQPIKADNPIIKKEKKTLQELVQRTVDYKVQDTVYTLNGSDLIKNATVTKDMQVRIDPAEIKNKVTEINNAQSTLKKNFSFKTHSGSVISVKGESYGWALKVDKETEQVKAAFEKGEKSLEASHVYGVGWSTYGTGFKTTANDGIGDTYAEVSIAEQRIWIYKNGKLALTTNVVTGRHDTKEDTPPGVWYIMYKETPSILEGTSAGHGGSYSVKVQYWAPFTLSGCGFHDASWRTNWKSDAYLNAGSGGCVNTQPSIMKAVYDNLSKNEPVIIY